MQYAVLCYHDEDVVFSWTQAEDDALMARIHAVKEKAIARGRLGPTTQLMPTTAATTLRNDRDPPLVVDGPFAETREQLLGVYMLEADDLEEALGFVRDLAKAGPGGAYEIRPIRRLDPGGFRP